MKLKRKARHYARALFAAAESLDSVTAVGTSMEIILQLLKDDAVFRAFFQTGKIKPSDKGSILKTVLGDKLHALNIEFFVMLAEKKEYLLFTQVAKGFRELQVRAGKVVTVIATTAEPLGDEELELVKNTLAQATGKDLKFSTEIDPQLLGGIKLRVGNLIIDGSLKSRLVRMRQQLIES